MTVMASQITGVSIVYSTVQEQIKEYTKALRHWPLCTQKGETISTDHGVGLQEFCQLETFVASCDVTEVIIMETAYYGRMRLGRCVKGDLGYMGCSADVLDIADRMCSGRHRCEIPIPNEDFERTRPCYRELKSHLEASYACVKVASLEGSICQSCDSIKVTKLSGYIASIVSQNTGCGTSGCPWIIEASPGQRINITLFDFTRPAKEDTLPVNLDNQGGCQHMTEYIFIKEDSRSHPISLCSGTKRIRHIYLSATHKVELMMTSDMGAEDPGQFILRHEALGCADMDVGPMMVFHREGAFDATVECTATSQSWHITCMERTWVGEVGNCSLGGSNQESARIAIGGLNVAYGTAIIIIVFVAILVGILILLIGLIGWRWYGKSCFRSRRGRSKNKRGRSSASDKAPPYDEEPVEGYETYVTRCPVDLYTHAWEVTRPILDRDVTLITDDVHKAHMMATYCTKECQNACTFKGCRKHPTDTYGTSTYGRPETHETATVDPTRYFEHQDPQL